MLMTMMTSVLLILGIFCSAAWAQPGEFQCMSSADRECFRPLQTAYAGLRPQQIWNQIATTDLSETCGPVMTAKECIIRKMEECGVFDSTNPRIVDAIRQIRAANRIVNYVCRDHVEVFNEFKSCLMHVSGGVPAIASAVERQCPMPEPPGPTTPFCVPRSFAACVANLVEQQCGEEIAGHLRALGAEVMQEAGCGTRKHFKMMKKGIQSPLELINEALSSLF